MRLLIDTNVFLEIALSQERAREAMNLLAETAKHDFFISDYSLHSLGLLFFRRKQHDEFLEFVKDTVVNTGCKIASLSLNDMESVVRAALRFKLDFDDAYQYVAAERYHLTIVSFDGDFDRTDRGRKTPSQLVP